MKLNRRKLHFFFAAAAMLTSVSHVRAQNAIPTSTQSARKVSDVDQQKGEALRKAIDSRFDELDRVNAIKVNGKDSNRIDDVVLQFIPLGTPFTDAEKILAAAGFTLSNPGNLRPFKNYFAIHATINHYMPTLLGNTSIIVDLQPRSATDWSVVHALSAVILKQYV